MVEHQPSKLRVAGSNPVSRSKNGCIAHVAQLAEHFLGKEEVTGSIPVVGLDVKIYRRRRENVEGKI